MTPLPPPAPTHGPVATPPTGSRRRLVIAAVAATALGVGGVAAGARLAAADDEPTNDDSTPNDDVGPIDAATGVDVEPGDDAPVDDEGDPDEQRNDDADRSDEEHDGRWEFPEFDELETAFDELDRCLAEQLPDLGDSGWIDIEGGELPDIADWDNDVADLLGGWVTVFSPESQDGDLTLLDFGDGDGTITITQTDGEISVSTEGDVETVDAELPDLSDLEFPDIGFEPDPDVDAALENCISLLPGDDIFELVGDLFTDFVPDGE